MDSTPDFLDLAQKCLEDARLKSHTMALPDGLQQQEAVIVQEAMAFSHATKEVAGLQKISTRALLYLLTEMELGKHYRYIPERYESLRDWAIRELNTHLEPDTLLRYCNTVIDLLIPVEQGRFVGAGGELIQAEQVIERVDLRSLKELPYTFKQLSPERRQVLVEAVTGEGSYGVRCRTARKLVEEQAAEDEARQPDPERPAPPRIVQRKIVLQASLLATGEYQVRGCLSQAEMLLLQSLLGEKLDVQLVSPEVSYGSAAD